MKNLTLVIPAKNEPESLPYVLMELEKLNLNYTQENDDFLGNITRERPQNIQE